MSKLSKKNKKVYSYSGQKNVWGILYRKWRWMWWNYWIVLQRIKRNKNLFVSIRDIFLKNINFIIIFIRCNLTDYFDTKESTPKCRNFITLLILFNFLLIKLNIFFLQVPKKSNGKECSDIIGECNENKGLICIEKNNIKLCS